MSQVKIYLVEGDSAPDLEFTVQRDGVAVDLTTATRVELRIYSTVDNILTNGPNADPVTSDDCTVTDATAGKVTYDLKDTDIPKAGVYLCDLVITWSSTQIETEPDYIILYVRPKAGTIS